MPNKLHPIYELKQIRHIYGSKNGTPAGTTREHAFAVNDLSISRCRITGLVGPNGSGKSTLLKLLAFALRPTKGVILYNGRPAHPFSKAVRFNVTLLTQAPYLLKRRVIDNILYGLKLRGTHQEVTRDAIEQRIDESMEMVGLDYASFAHRRWNELSGGEAQRVAMAARLVLKPEVLLLDEPTASVDVESADLIRKAAIFARQEWGTTIVVASHDHKWLYDICDKHLHLEQGRVKNATIKV